MTEDNKIDKESLNKAWYQASLWTAIVAGIFILVIAGLLMANYFFGQATKPMDSEELTKLKGDIFRQPNNEVLKEQIRQLDLQMREEFFRRREFSWIGGYMLIAGIIIFLISAKFVYDYQKEPPIPNSAQQTNEARIFKFARWSVGTFGLIFGVIALFLIVLNSRYSMLDVGYLILNENKLPDEEQQLVSRIEDQGIRIQNPEPSVEVQESEIQDQELIPSPPAPPGEPNKNWPRFRGPGGLGISPYTNIPASWNGKTGTNIKWKSPVPLPGKNSPVVWGNKVFLTGATETKREVYCFDANSGKLIWQKAVENVPFPSPEPVEVSDDTGYAAPTVVTDGIGVYAIFANGDLVGLDLNGNQLWAQNFGPFDNIYGYASSLLMYENLLIVLLDQGGKDDGISEIIALDSNSGKMVWKTPRPVGSSWASPILIDTGKRKEIITCGTPYVIAYEPKTGKELWRVKCLSGDIAPSPVFNGELVFATNAYATLAAIRPGGSGDVTATNIVWQADDGLPDITSPLANKEFIFLIETYGHMTCYDAKNGNPLWGEDLDGTFNASPSLVGDKVYLINNEGVTIIVNAGREFKEIGKYELGESVDACPAFADGRIFIRGDKNLYCIGK